jgi:hypothetical protein
MRLALLGLARDEGEFISIKSSFLSNKITKFFLTPISFLLLAIIVLFLLLSLSALLELGNSNRPVYANTETGAYLRCMEAQESPLLPGGWRRLEIEPNPIVRNLRTEECLRNLKTWIELGKKEEVQGDKEFFRKWLRSYYNLVESVLLSQWRLFLLIPLFFVLFIRWVHIYPSSSRQDALARCFIGLNLLLFAQFGLPIAVGAFK